MQAQNIDNSKKEYENAKVNVQKVSESGKSNNICI